MAESEITTVFVECVSCGREQVLAGYDAEDRVAARAAHRRGWTVRGFYGASRTRCPGCRRKRRKDTEAADEGRIGKKAGFLTTGRARA